MSRLNGTLNGVHKRAPKPEKLKSEAESSYERMRAAAFDSIAGSVMALGSYDAASPSRLRPDIGKARGGSADSHRDSSTRQSLARQCEDLERNSSLARGLVERQVDLTIGDGYSPRVKTDDEDWNAECEWLINRIAGEDEDGTPRPEGLAHLSDAKLATLPTFDIRGRWSMTDALADILRRWDYNGDIGVNFVSNGSVQFVEGERIVNPGRGWDKGIGPKGTPIVGGVEMDSYGKAVRYHIATYNSQGNMAFGSSTTAVDADNFMLLCNPLRDVTGSTRGEPQLQACLKRLEHLEAMDETVLVAARIQAAIAAVIKLKRPDMDVLSQPGSTETRDDGTTERWEESEPGRVKRLQEDEDVVFPPPSQPGQHHEAYCLFQYLICCAELGVSLPVGLLDGRGLNLATIRSIMQVAWLRTIRNQKGLKKFSIRWYRFITPWLIRNGFLRFNPQWEAHEWMAPPPPVMDPMVALQEARGLIDARIKSKKRVAMETYGVNTTTEDDQIQRELDEGAERGILPVAQPGSGPGSPGGVAAAPASADSEDAKKDKHPDGGTDDE